MENINSDLAKLATTASVLVTSATTNSNINEMLQKNRTFTSTFESNIISNDGSEKSNFMVRSGNRNGLIGLLAKHGDNIRAAQNLKRSNFTPDGKKKKDFSILSNDMLSDIPNDENNKNLNENESNLIFSDNNEISSPFSLFQGFSAVLPEIDETIQNIKGTSGKLLEDVKGKKKGKNLRSSSVKPTSRLKKIEEISSEKIKTCQKQRVLLNFKSDINYHLDLLEIRKGLSQSEIMEIDTKIDRLYNLRKEISDNVKYYEDSETKLENQLLEIEERLEFIKDIEVPETNTVYDENNDTDDVNGNKNEKYNGNIGKKIRNSNKSFGNLNDKSNNSIISNKKSFIAGAKDDEYDDDYVTVYMEEDSKSYSRVTSSAKNLKSGDQIHKFQAHNESINCLAFDEPFGRMITCSMDNTVRLWDMNRYRCYGLLEGHNAYVDCITMNNNLVFTGSMDASVKMWDIDYFSKNQYAEELEDEDNKNKPLIHSFEGHVDIVTALSYNNEELVSGSEDKTIRQWDLTTGHLIQTIDVMWASSMANSMINFGSNSNGRNNIRNNNNNVINGNIKYPYLSCLQVFDAALASGSSDGIVRLWDLRSGEVIRQLFGHTGAITTLQFDKNFNLVTGSADRSLRIWDLRSGGLLDSFSYDNPIKKIEFDDMKIVSVVENERGVHVFDRNEDRHWMLGGDILGDSNNVNSVNSEFVNDMTFSGNYLVEGRADGTVGVWNV